MKEPEAGTKTMGDSSKVRKAGWSLVAVMLGLAVYLIALGGCDNFFQCENKPACPASGSTGTTGSTGSKGGNSFTFVSYTTTAGQTVVTGYNLRSGTLSAVNTVTLPFVASAMAVNPANTRLYVASVPGATTPGVYLYTIGTDGSLSVGGNGSALVQDLVGAMTISPDGNYLYTVQSTGTTMTQYVVDSVTGGLGSGGALTVPSLTCALAATTPVLPTCAVTVSPSGTYAVASFGSQGDAVFGYSSSTGIADGGRFSQITAAANSGDFSAAIDANDRLYLGQTSTLNAWQLASTGNSNLGAITYPSGTIPRSVVVDPASRYVYAAGVGVGKVYGYAIGTSTALTAVSGSPFAGPSRVAAIGVNSASNSLVAVGYDATAGIQLYSIGSGGVLTPLATAGTTTATQYPVLVAMSH